MRGRASIRLWNEYVHRYHSTSSGWHSCRRSRPGTVHYLPVPCATYPPPDERAAVSPYVPLAGDSWLRYSIPIGPRKRTRIDFASTPGYDGSNPGWSSIRAPWREPCISSAVARGSVEAAERLGPSAPDPCPCPSKEPPAGRIAPGHDHHGPDHGQVIIENPEVRNLTRHAAGRARPEGCSRPGVA